MNKRPLDALIAEIREISSTLIEHDAAKALLEMQLDQLKKSIERTTARKRLLQEILKSHSETQDHDIVLAKLEAE